MKYSILLQNACSCFSKAVDVWLNQTLFGKGAKLLKIETKQSKINELDATENPVQTTLNNIEFFGSEPLWASELSQLVFFSYYFPLCV